MNTEPLYKVQLHRMIPTDTGSEIGSSWAPVYVSGYDEALVQQRNLYHDNQWGNPDMWPEVTIELAIVTEP